MSKRYLILALIILILLSSVLPINASKYYYDDYWRTHEEIVSIYVDGTKVKCDVPPIIVNDRTLVPARAFFENIGATVNWDEKLREVTIKNSKYIIKLSIDSEIAYVNDSKYNLDVSAMIIVDELGNGRTMIPLRFISAQMGYTVLWDQATLTAKISKPEINNILKIESSENSNKNDVISISLNGNVTPKILTLTSPFRLVIDFENTVITGNKYSTETTGNNFTNIRYSNHDDYARIVVDLIDECSYKTEISSNICNIYLGNNNEDIIIDKELKPDGEEADENKKPSLKGGTGLVVIDAGHGGSDPGAIGYEDGVDVIHESEVNLDISVKVYNILKNEGVNVIMTRSADVYVGLHDRADIANNLDATLFICIHNNSSTIKSANGSMTFYYNSGEDTSVNDAYGLSSKKLANIIQKKIINSANRYDRGIEDGSSFVVLNSTRMPAVLIECAFLSNEEERNLLKTDSFRQLFADGIAQGVLEALKIMGKR